MKIAVVIPTLDEEAMLGRTLRLVRRRGEAEVVVVADCGSADRTVSIAVGNGAVVTTGGGRHSRAAAMAAGAACAVDRCPDLGAILFLHADTLPAPRWDAAVASVLTDRRVVGGAFDFAWDLRGVGRADRAGLLSICHFNRVRMRVTRFYYGDQGIFVRPDALAAIGGVPDATLLEDALLCRRLKRVGRLRLARGRTVTSPRRFLRHGILRQAMIDTVLLSAYQIGVEPAWLHAWYNREKG